MQPVDYTTLIASCCELRGTWVPARLEQVYQRDRHTISIALRTLKQRGWLTVCWHPQAAHLCMGDAPPRTPDTFTFSQQLQHQLGGLALVAIEPIAPWERVVDLQFAQRPGEPPLWHLYIEIMGKYSNVILVNADGLVVTAAHQVSAQQSSVRPIQTGQPYELPPVLTDTIPNLNESWERWQERLSLIPAPLKTSLLKTYRGLSSALAASMMMAAGLHPDQCTDTLTTADWQRLFQYWQGWLWTLEKAIAPSDLSPSDADHPVGSFQPGWTANGYTVMGWGMVTPVATVQDLLHGYYSGQLAQQQFGQLRHQLAQKLTTGLAKLRVKADLFTRQLQHSDQADLYRQQADLLMANLQAWQPGITQLIVEDFASGHPVTIPLEADKTGVQNAQALYKRHQKLRRSRHAVAPLLADINQELAYLEAVEAALSQLDTYRHPDDWLALTEIQQELIQQGYLADTAYGNRNGTERSVTGRSSKPNRSKASEKSVAREESQPYRYRTPSGFEVLIGRNNRQNDLLTSRTARDYDLWFHTQEIPGSHVLLRLPAGAVAETDDLQFVANLAAYHSRARHSEQVPVVYTEPRHVYKPKGAKPGMVIYQRERVIWGQPQRVLETLDV